MNIKTVGINNDIAVVQTQGLAFKDAQSALDIMADVKYQTECNKIILQKSAVHENFFILSSGLAGEILQKYVNYGVKLAVVGDFSVYTSKPLKDFIYESNNGKTFFFVSTVDEAIEKLSQ